MTRKAIIKALIQCIALLLLLEEVDSFRALKLVRFRTSRHSRSDKTGSSLQDRERFKPLLSIPIPGSKTATLQIPGPFQVRALVEFAVEEARSVGVRNGAARTWQAQQAFATVLSDGLASGEISKLVHQSQTDTLNMFLGGIRGLGVDENNNNNNGKASSLLERETEEASRRRVAPKLLRQLFEELGATYVKLGQFIASSPTLFPPE
jgi:hypothetical protein